jgi:hypothetical protein
MVPSRDISPWFAPLLPFAYLMNILDNLFTDGRVALSSQIFCCSDAEDSWVSQFQAGNTRRSPAVGTCSQSHPSKS